jgi:nucleoside-diphosphate-sugar epimerase
MKKRVLVTGASGCVGRNVLPELVTHEWEVHAISRRAAPNNRLDVVWHQADLFDPHQLAQVVRHVEASHLLHLAWYLPPRLWPKAPEHFRWVHASLELLHAFQRAGGCRIVTTGSCLEYDWSYGYCSEERTPCNPHTVYGVCKNALQMLTAAFAANNGMTSAWGRIFNLYGPYEHPDRLVPSVIRSLLAGQPARCSHGEQIRDYLFAEDVASALVALLETDVTGPINIGCGQPLRLKEIVLQIGRLLGRPELIQLGSIAEAPTDMPLVVADVTRLTTTLQWRPRFDLEDGLARTIEWWRECVTMGEPVGLIS